ncbi:hypothetical protein PFICI_03246 [Pestalotiopsis fici W106-1]|uniref:nicotinamidase n=1 Tax=Pestalotiopsis fici (strain W106-1 / CGMCC3.15140) TaxID=1229662 RepID=W3XJ50_PESFW|nr:uncharacterized protein PFICI_03246 [Pestalotiopsis fici W106-1]ETS85221.1 hypothetical protein PFICI_03246 [Pestalotiopsis fici W106-1]
MFGRAYTSLLALASVIQAVPFSSRLHKNTALVLIDVQNDFITGSLNNSRAPAILPKIYQLLDDHEWPFIAASQDWHPIDHVSFASAHPGKESGDSVNITFLDTPTKIETQGFRTPVNYIKKAQNHSVDSCSAFADNQYHQFTTLDSELSLHSIETLVITGLITNACVRGTSIDGIKLGYEVILIEDATETTSDEAKATAITELEGWGVQVMNLTDWEAAYPTSSKARRLLEL